MKQIVSGGTPPQQGENGMDTAKMFTAQGAALLVQSDGCAVWQFRNETCDGTNDGL